jgi:hypothetical protein
MSRTPALENTEAILAGVALGGRLDTQTAVFLGAGAVVVCAEAAGVEVEVEVEAVDVDGPLKVVSVTSTSPTFLFFCFSILCCLASTALAGV